MKENFIWEELVDTLFGKFGKSLDSVINTDYNQVAGLKYKAYSTDDLYILEFAIPGYDKEDVKISIEDDALVLSADIKEKETNFWKSSFNSKFRIPQDADFESINAKLEKGILRIEVAKTVKNKLKTIDIK